MISLEELIGISPAIETVRAQIEQLIIQGLRAHQLPSILLQGETGTGKGLVARLIHREGPRRDGPFVDVNCSAIPDGLLEAELFGFERGAFTDARQAKPGLLQQAHQGTLFLDEVGLLPESLQPKLLKAIEDRAVRRLGGTRQEKVDVHIIAASNEHLAPVMRARRFRSDLYHRIAVVNLTLPPLRGRTDDILLLAEHFLSHTCRTYRLVPPRRFAADARTALLGYSWPGNIRELSNVVESAALLTKQSTITSAALKIPCASAHVIWSQFDERLADLEREQLVAALSNTKWNVSRAATRLGISRNRLRYRIERHQLKRDGSQHAAGTSAARSDDEEAFAVGTPAPAELPTTLLWEGRHLALLRVDLPSVLNERMPAERALRAIADRIRSFGGSVEELGATTLVGAFGLEPIENAASNAALAALAIRESAGRRDEGESRFPAVKIALHSGRLLVGRVDGRAQINLDDKLETGSVLAELSAAARADRIIISKDAAPFLERCFQLEREAPAAADGGWLYGLAGRERTGFGLAGRALTQLVGRQRELDAVTSRLSEAERCRGQIVAIVSEPGVGKSRLVYELIQTDRVTGWRILSCRAFSYGATTPSLPVIELLKDYFHIHDRDTSSEVHEKVSEGLLTCLGEADPRRSAILALLDLPIEDDKWRKLEAGQRRQRTFEAIKQILLQESLVQPLIVIFEDLHWIDTETQGLLDSLVESLPAARLLLLVTYRPEYRHRWGPKTYYTQLHLSPLAAENAQTFLERLMGEDDSLQPIKQLLVERTDGNPLFLEESVRALAETGVIEGSRHAYRLSEAAPNFEVPVTIQAILAARITRLLPEDKRLLEAAAAIGRDIPYALLAGIWKGPEEALCGGLARLQEAELLYETTLPPNRKHTFKHALTHEVTYGSLTGDRRRDLHAEITTVSERVYEDRLSEHAVRLAHHAFRGQLWEKAVRYGRQAGNRALDRSALREALAHFEQARVALQELPESRKRTEQRIDLCFEQRNALFPLGEFARLSELLGEARTLAERLDDQQRLGWALGYLSLLRGVLSEHVPAIEAGERARAIAEMVGDLGLRVFANYYLGHALWLADDPRRAAEPLRKAIGLLEHAPLGERFGMVAPPAVLARYVLATVSAELGEFAEALAVGEEGVRIARAAGHSHSEVWARRGLGYVHLHRGNFAQAARVLEPGLALCRAVEIRLALPHLAALLGSAYLWSGRLVDAVPLLEEAVTAITTMGILGLRSRVIPFLAEAYLVLGRGAEAREQAEHAVALASAQGERGWEAWGLKLLGDIRAHELAESEQAWDAYQRALALASELGMRPLIAHCHYSLGKLYEKANKHEQAEENLAIGTAMYREMGMQFWLEQMQDGSMRIMPDAAP